MGGNKTTRHSSCEAMTAVRWLNCEASASLTSSGCLAGCPEEKLLTAACVHCQPGCVARPCYQGPLFWMATRALKHKIKNPVAVYFPLGKTNKPTDKQKTRLIELSICASNIKRGLSSALSLPQCELCCLAVMCHSRGAPRAWRGCWGRQEVLAAALLTAQTRRQLQP